MIMAQAIRLAMAIFCVASMSCHSPERAKPDQALRTDDLSIYRKTNDQAGHELVKAEQFLVPVGTAIAIKGLEFERGSSALTPIHNLIIQQIFNSLEEITENTVGDTNAVRVGEFKKMEFEIRGYPDDVSGSGLAKTLAEARAKATLDRLTYLGTPPWRLRETGLVAPAVSNPTATNRILYGVVEFIRTR